MKKVSAVEIFSKAFYFTFSNFDLIILIFLIHATASVISSIVSYYFSPPFLIEYEYISTFFPTSSTSKIALLVEIVLQIFLFLTYVFSLIIIFLYIFAKRYKKVSFTKIIVNTKNYYLGTLIIVLVLMSIFILPILPFTYFILNFSVPSILSQLLLILSFLALLVILIYISLRLSLSLPIYFERKEVVESLKKSWKITKGNVFKLFLVNVLVGLVTIAFFALLTFFLLLVLLTDIMLRVVLNSLIFSLFTSLFQILTASSHAFFYFKLKGRR